MARPELKLAGMRIDPEIFARSKMGYSLDMAIVEADQVGAWFWLLAGRGPRDDRLVGHPLPGQDK